MTKLVNGLKKKEGFTLVELMVVLVIIGILVAIAIPVYNSTQETATRNTCQANLRTIDGAIQQWHAANPVSNTYTLVYTNPTTTGGVYRLVNAGYLKAVPVEPTGSTYTVVQDSACGAKAQCQATPAHTY
ncbi:MAG: competence type IV pilus major pilin ComGC [Candidatus Saccharibacteria bacterium]